MQNCKICKKITKGGKTCSSECLGKLRSINASRLIKQGKIPKPGSSRSKFKLRNK